MGRMIIIPLFLLLLSRLLQLLRLLPCHGYMVRCVYSTYYLGILYAGRVRRIMYTHDNNTSTPSSSLSAGVPNRVRYENTQYTINIKSPSSSSLCVPVLSDLVTVCLLYLLFYYDSPYFSFFFFFFFLSVQYTYPGDGSGTMMTVTVAFGSLILFLILVAVAVAVAVNCRI